MSKSRMGAPRRVATGLVAGALMIVGIAHAPAAGAADTVTSERLAGATRYGTAAAVSADAAFEGATTAILATGENFPDALAASGLAGSTAATPILLTQSDSLSDEALAALDDLAVDSVTVVGGTAAVSDDVVTSLEENGYTVDRVAGENRYATAAAIADEMGAAGEVDGLVSALIATGENYPDALAGGPAAYAGNLPILLVNSDGIPAETEAALDSLGIEQAIVLGGTAAVSDDTAADLAEATGNDVVRLAGTNRFGTAAAVGDFEIDSLGFDGPDYILTTGVNFPDALSAGPLGGQLGAPIVLTASLPDESAQFLDDHSDILENQKVVGGTGSVDDETAAAGVSAAQQTGNDTPTGGDTVTSGLLGPELQSVSLGGIDLDDLAISYNFVFDTDLDEDTVNPEMFKLYPYANDDAALGDVFNEGDEMDIDGDTVNVVFNLADRGVTNATLAAVEEAAVEDEDGNPNPAQSVVVSGIVNSAGNGLVSAEVTDEDEGVVEFTFAGPQVPGGNVGNVFELITREGDVISGVAADAAEAFYNKATTENAPDEDEPSNTVEVTFLCNGDDDPDYDYDGDTDDTNDPCSGKAADEGADLSGLNFRRAIVRSTSSSRMSEAVMGSGGVTSAPDLADIQLASDNEDLEDDEALFVFDEAIDTLGTTPSAFSLLYSQCSVGSQASVTDLIGLANANDTDSSYEVPDGEGYDDEVDFSNACKVNGTSAILGADDDDEFSNRTVLVTFANEDIDNIFLLGAQVQGNVASNAGVSEAGDDDLSNDDDVLFLTPDKELFADGEVAGPQLIGADVEVETTFSGDFRNYLITLTFDKDIDDTIAGGIDYWYDEDGNVEQDAIDLGDCEVEDDTTIECTIDDEDSPFAGATVISVDAGTVTGTDTFTVDSANAGISYTNPEVSIAVEVPEA